MNKKYIKIGAITLVSLGAIYGGYKLVKYLIGKSQEQKNQEIPVEIVDTSNKEEIKVVAKPTFDGAKIISKGSKGEEAKAVQQAITPTINKNVVPQYNWGSSSISSYTTSLQKPYLVSQIDATKEARRKKVASLKPLIADGDFGAKSVSTLIVIMGKSSASYNEVRDKRIAFSKVYGLGNPYKK
jgi:hypothetical protein